MEDSKLKKTEKATLQTFRKEVPSNYYSYDDKISYERYLKNIENTYMYKYKFPPKMFQNIELIDFGAGTGHRAINFANWGAKCTLVELSDRSSEISKKLFKNYAPNFDDHKFFNTSIFDYEEKGKKYDIVHCVGVLSHTAAKEKAFKKICSFLKPGGYLIFGDPNKSGGFQNMLQRYALYKYSKDDEEIVTNSEILFKNDIDRSEKAVGRTRREIIFDRWVIQSQDDPSVSEVLKWIEDNNLKFYSMYPNYPDFLITDSFYNKNKSELKNIDNLAILSEIIWMTKTKDDYEILTELNNELNDLNLDFSKLSSYLANCNTETKIGTELFFEYSDKLSNNIKKLPTFKNNLNSIINFINEAKEFIKVVNNGDFVMVKDYVKKCKLLFKGPVGIRHVDYIAYKN